MNTQLTLETVIARQNGDGLMSSELSANELVMLSISRNSYYGLDESAKIIWDHLAEPRSIAAVVAHLRSQFAVDAETCEREVTAFIQELLKDELVQIVNKTA
jgi:hypothetical protein